MKLVRKVLKVFFISTGVVIVLAIIVAPKDNKKDEVTTTVNAPVENTEQVKNEPEPVVEAVIESEVKVETVEEQMARWDRGEFTEEEIAEIKAEEKREDAALKAQFQ